MAMTRAELNQAFREVASMEFADIPADESMIPFEFSEKFTKKMEKLIARQKKPYWKYVNTAKKRVAIAVIAVLSLCMVALGNEEIRASMLQWCEDVYEEYIRYYFEGDTTKKIEYVYQLTMVPEGFEVEQEIGNTEYRLVKYRNNAGDSIKLEQGITEDRDYYWDNENGEWNTEILNDKEVKLFD
ncbi:MAG: hypothetical protein IJE49_12720 [Agathobacter sp.]|nr:hypothetical protein [Agathobacter sp.]MBQ2902689.1 hypothetical protein [Agathobacter sp.]